MSFFLFLSVFVSLFGCTDGGDDGYFRTANDPSGRFLNGEAQGVQYESYTWRDGVTDAEGSFVYAPGEEMTFSVGGIQLGTAVAAESLTPIDLVPGAVDSTDPTAVNITRFLMSLDQDGNSGNGIAITEETREALAGSYLDFSSEQFDEQAQVIIESLPANESGEDIYPEARELVPAPVGQAYLEGVVIAIEEEEAAAEAEASIFACHISKPLYPLNMILVQGQYVPLEGFVKGGSEQYTYEWSIKKEDGTSEPQIVSQTLNPGDILSSLAPGTYTLALKIVDTDGNQGTDQRLVTVIDPQVYGPIPYQDQALKVWFTNVVAPPLTNTIPINGSLSVQTAITEGNPPFYYYWILPVGVNYTWQDNPLNATFTFNTTGAYSIYLYTKDTLYNYTGPDTWYTNTVVIVE